MRRHDLTKKDNDKDNNKDKDNTFTKTMTLTKTMTKTKTFREHPKGVIIETYDLRDI